MFRFPKKQPTVINEKYFKLIKPSYIFIRIIPHKSIRNYNSTNIAKAIAHTYKTLDKKIRFEQRKLTFETNFKISYMIDIESNNVSFYFIVPEVFENILLEKISEIWSKATVERVDNIKPLSPTASKYQLRYKKEDALSLYVDKKSNEPLNSILNVMEIMKDDDRVTIIYNFIPRNQLGWAKQYKDTIDKIESHKPVLREKLSTGYIVKNILSAIIDLLDVILEILNDFMGGTNKKSNDTSLAKEIAIALWDNEKISQLTKSKKEAKVIDTQMVIVSSSNDKTRQDNNALAVCQSYRSLDDDNELNYYKITSNVSPTVYRFPKVDTNTLSVDECQNLIQIPGRQLLKDFKINYIKTEENPVPEKLQSGYINLGNVKFKNNKQEAYIEDEYDKGSLPLIPVGAQGSGKSTFMANYYRFANTRKEGGVVIDFIKNCEMTKEVISYLPQEDQIVLNYTKEDCIQGFAFNEFKINDNMSTFEKLSLTNLQAQQVLTFVDSINIEQPLQARMRKYLSAASNVVFATGENSLKEVVKCLEEWDIRHKYIDLLNDEEQKYLEDEIKSLNDLDEWSKVTKDNPVSEIIGTKDSKIEGILDRISLLREDFKLKYMFNKGSNGNIDFAEELENGKTIIIRMPQDSFKKHAKNIIVTFLLSKIWIATEIRGKLNEKPKPTHISIDEVFQCKTAMKMLADDEILPQCRKFGAKFIFSCQYTDQIDILMDTLIGAGASFMFLTGTSEKDFEKFQNKIVDFEYEDLKDMEEHSSLNLIYYSGGYASFISKLPKPIK